MRELFTADLHIGHTNIIKHCNRPFEDIDEMNKIILNNWNKTVQRDDLVYILGDVALSNRYGVEEFLQKAKGRKILIKGNHDGWVKGHFRFFFEDVLSYLQIKRNGKIITMCHYPMMSWEGINKNGIMLYGHIHNNRPMIYLPQMYNVGMDVNKFRPVTLDEAVVNNKEYYGEEYDI